MEDFIRELGFDDCNFFTIDDYQVFLPMKGPLRPPASEQIEQDRQGFWLNQST